MPAEIRQCTNPACRLRFPAEVGLLKASRCPFCAWPTEAELTIANERQHNPRWSGNSGAEICGLLDNLRSSFNVGSIFRSADGAGLRQLYLAGTTPTPEHPKVRKTALGAEETVDWSYHRNGLELARELAASGTQLWALEVSSRAGPLYGIQPVELLRPVVLVVGSEVHGIDPAILEICSRHLWVPMQGFKRSLNVAVAFSIAAYHLRFGLQPQPD